MNATAYQFDIAREDTARGLHELYNEIRADDSLDSEEKTQICNLIREKFCRLNAAAAGPQTPRWK